MSVGYTHMQSRRRVRRITPMDLWFASLVLEINRLYTKHEEWTPIRNFRLKLKEHMVSPLRNVTVSAIIEPEGWPHETHIHVISEVYENTWTFNSARLVAPHIKFRGVPLGTVKLTGNNLFGYFTLQPEEISSPH